MLFLIMEHGQFEEQATVELLQLIGHKNKQELQREGLQFMNTQRW